MDELLLKIKNEILHIFPEYGLITDGLDFVIDDTTLSNGIPTCATDGKKLMCHSECLKTSSHDDRIYLFSHEITHVAFNHIERGIGKNPDIWNIAVDAVTNQILKMHGIKLRNGSVDFEDAKNVDAETYYEKLMIEQKENEKDTQNGNQQEDTKNQKWNWNTGGPNHHELWKEAMEKIERGEISMEPPKTTTSNENKIEPLSQNDEEERHTNLEMKEETQKLQELMHNLVHQASMSTGTGSNAEVINFSKTRVIQPLVEWRYLLREALQIDADWSYQSAEIEYGVITPKLEINPKPETQILLDTSNSVSNDLLKAFLSECKYILMQSKTYVGCFDVNFYGWQLLKNIEEIDQLKLIGRGATDFQVAVSSFSRRVENKVIFTDGYADMPTTHDRVIWVVYGDKEIKPNGGRVIYVSQEQLEKAKQRIKK